MRGGRKGEQAVSDSDATWREYASFWKAEEREKKKLGPGGSSA